MRYRIAAVVLLSAALLTSLGWTGESRGQAKLPRVGILTFDAITVDPTLEEWFEPFRRTLAKLARKYRLPATSMARSFAEAGGLIAYGPELASTYERSAIFVAKILGGAKPADLPVERPTKVQLVVNLKTAKAFGLTIPESVLYRADEVIR